MEDQKEVIGITWRCGTIGIVAVNYPNSRPRPYWQAYMGIGEGDDIDRDVREITDWGDKLSWQEAQVFFPDLQIKRYKTWDGPELKSFYVKKK